MGNKPFFSIQIAAYNVENYLEQCLGSILNQSEQDFEILLVDDCSTDGTGKRCDEFAAQYPDRIVAVHNEENLGLLLTRRVAYKIARGEWILSVDADDLLAEGALAELRHAIKTHDCDLVLYNLTCIQQNGSRTEFSLELEDGKVYRGEEKKQVYLQRYKNDFLNSMCTKAVRRDLIDMEVDYLQFRKLYKGTDIFQSYPILDRAQSILYWNRSLYWYIKREASLTTKLNLNWYPAKKLLWSRDDEYLAKWEIDAKIQNAVYHSRIREIVLFADLVLSDPVGKKRAKELFREIREDGSLAKWYRAVGKNTVKFRHRLYCNCLLKGHYLLLSALSFVSGLLRKHH